MQFGRHIGGRATSTSRRPNKRFFIVFDLLDLVRIAVFCIDYKIIKQKLKLSLYFSIVNVYINKMAISPPALTATLRRLEKELGCQLFDRSG